MSKSDFKTICNAVVEGSLSLGGCTIFFSKLFDTVGNKFTTFNPLSIGISLPGILFSLPFSITAGYGAYKCHDEVGKSNQPHDKARLLDAITAETNRAESDLIAVESLSNADDTDATLHDKTKKELIDIIKELKALVAEQKAKLAGEETEKQQAQSTPLKLTQRLGIAGEYIAHSAGFTGDILGLVSLFGGIPFEAEIALQVCCLVVGYVSAMSEARTAEESMRLNNMRENLLRHHSLFKQLTPQHGKIQLFGHRPGNESPGSVKGDKLPLDNPPLLLCPRQAAGNKFEIRIDSSLSLSSTDTSNSPSYQKLSGDCITYPHRLSLASS